MLVICAYIITALTFPIPRYPRIFVNFSFSQAFSAAIVDPFPMPFEPNLRAFQRGVIGLTGADQNVGDDRSFKRGSEK
jgi:hypothetical protein